MIWKKLSLKMATMVLDPTRIEGTLLCVMEAVVAVATIVLVRKLKADRKNDEGC